MKLLNTQQHKGWWTSFMVMLVLLVPHTATALVVDYEQTPLFSDMNILPGDSLTRTVVVTNDGNAAQPVYATVENEFNTGLADVMQLTVNDGVITLFSGSFADFFATTPVMLGQQAVGDSQTYYFTAALASSTDNEYQKSTFGFDLVVGLTERLDDGEPYSATNFDRGARGSGFAGRQILTIYGESLLGVGTSTAVITWNTDRSATSYLLCGDTIDGPFSPLDLNDPQFGYPFSVPENSRLSVVHQATVTGLLDGNYECRPASRRTPSSDFTVGDPIQFTIGTPAPTLLSTTVGEDASDDDITMVATVLAAVESVLTSIRDRFRPTRGR